MARKSEQQLSLEERKRFLTACMRKARKHKDRMDYVREIRLIDEQLYPNPVTEAKAQAAATKLAIKKQKADAKEAQRKEAEELERLKEIERQKIRDESNPVTEHLKLAAIHREMKERVEVSQQIEPEAAMGVDVPVTSPVEVNEAPSSVITPSPEIVDITRQATAEVAKQSTASKMTQDEARRASGIGLSPDLLDMYKVVSRPLGGDAFLDYQERAAREAELRRRHAEQHPTPGEPRERGVLIDSFTGLPANRE